MQPASKSAAASKETKAAVVDVAAWERGAIDRAEALNEARAASDLALQLVQSEKALEALADEVRRARDALGADYIDAAAKDRSNVVPVLIGCVIGLIGLTGYGAMVALAELAR